RGRARRADRRADPARHRPAGRPDRRRGVSMLASAIRTVVPYIVGVIVGQAARLGLGLDEGAVTAIVTVVASYLYYPAARLLEERWPAAGRWLLALGLTRRAPEYVKR